MIGIYHGNDKFFKFTRKDYNGDPITTQPTGIYFTVKRSMNDDRFLFQKKWLNDGEDHGITQQEDGSWLIHVEPNDTDLLSYGKYYCDVKVQDEDGYEFTIVKPQELWILDVSTRLSNEVFSE